MKLKNGAEYMDSLRSISPVIYYKGKRIEDVVSHPATAPHVRAAAMTYALAADDEYKDLTAVAIIPVLINGSTKAILSLGSHSYDEIPMRDRHTLEAIAIQIAAYMTRLEAEDTISSTKLG